MYTEASDMPWFGELAVWLNKPQGGTAKALMHTSCLALRHDDFLRFVQIMPEFRSCLNKKARFWKGVTSQHSKDGHGVMQEAEELRVRLEWLGSGPRPGAGPDHGPGPGPGPTLP